MTACISSPVRSPATAVTARRSAILSRRAAGTLLLAVCLASALAGRLVYLARPFDSDGAMFIYMGRLITEGGRWGQDLVDNKFPTVGLITSVPWRLFGTCWAAYILLQTTLVFAAALYLTRAAGRSLGSYARRPTLLFALVYFNFTPLVFGGFQLESLQIVFAILAAGAALAALDGDTLADSFLVGLAAAMAAMMKPTGLAVGGAFALALLVRYRREPIRLIAHGAACLGGLLIPAACVLWYLLATGTLGYMPALCRQIARYAANSATDPWDLAKLMTVLVIGGFPFLVRGWIFRRPHNRLEGEGDSRFSIFDFGLKQRPEPPPKSKIQNPKSKFLFLLAWFGLATFGVVGQHRMYAYHFMVMAPPLAMLFGAIPRRDRTMSLAAALMPVALFSLYQAGVTLAYSVPMVQRLPLSGYLQSRTLPGDRIWMDDLARLLLETNLRSATRHPITFLFANWDSAPLEYTHTMLADFQAHRPVYLILPANLDRFLKQQTTYIAELAHFPQRAENYRIAWGQIEAYTHAHYRLETRLGDKTIWRRADLPELH